MVSRSTTAPCLLSSSATCYLESGLRLCCCLQVNTQQKRADAKKGRKGGAQKGRAQKGKAGGKQRR